MKTVGLIGGMSWESTSLYYQWVNEKIAERLGGLHSAKCVVYSVDFDEIEQYQREGNWQAAGQVLGEAAKRLELAGADFLLLCTNTMHKVIADVEQATNLPVLHIADPTAEAILSKGLSRVALLGTSYTMEQEFYKSRLAEKGIKVLTPDLEDREEVNRIIFQELCHGEIKESSRSRLIEIVAKLVDVGAEGVVLGCTEITLLIKPEHCPVPVFDTAELHVNQAVKRMLGGE